MGEHDPAIVVEELTELLYVAPIGLVKFRYDGKIDLISALAAQLLLPHLQRRDLSDFFEMFDGLFPDIRQRVRGFPDACGIVIDHEVGTAVVAGREVSISLTVRRLTLGDFVAVVEDLTKLVEKDRALIADRLRLQAIFDHLRDYAIYTIHNDGAIEEWNQSLQRFGGWQAEDLADQTLDLFFTDEDRRDGVVATLLEEARRVGSVETEGWRPCRKGALIWASIVITCLPWPDGSIRGFVVICRDMTERKHAEDELRRLASTDPLTGAFNRRRGYEMLDAALEITPTATAAVALLLLDIDEFKAVNDRFGHESGDMVLCAVVGALRERIEGSGWVVRWGGEEFLAILPATDPVRLAAVAEGLRTAVKSVRVVSEAGEIGVTISIGAAIAGLGDSEADVLLRRADQALYEAKRAGRDRVVFVTVNTPADFHDGPVASRWQGNVRKESRGPAKRISAPHA